MEPPFDKPIYKGEDCTGKQFGQWTVLKRVPAKTKRPRWQVQCTCSVVDVKCAYSLIFNTSTKCRKCQGASKKGDLSPKWVGVGEISGRMMSRLRGSAKRLGRTLPMEVDAAYLNSIWLEQARRCKYSGLPLTMGVDASLDRIDSTLGYVKGNVQWVHKTVNYMKWDTSEEEFLFMVTNIYKHVIKNLMTEAIIR